MLNTAKQTNVIVTEDSNYKY